MDVAKWKDKVVWF